MAPAQPDAQSPQGDQQQGGGQPSSAESNAQPQGNQPQGDSDQLSEVVVTAMRRPYPEQPLIGSFFGLDDLLGLATSKGLDGVGCHATCQFAVALLAPRLIKPSGAMVTRGLGQLGGIFTSTTNPAGGTIWTSEGLIVQSDFASLVNSGLYNGEVNILTGVHGFADGTTIADASLYQADVRSFGGVPGVNVYNVSSMTPGQISNVLNGSGTTIGAFCNSGACLLGR